MKIFIGGRRMGVLSSVVIFGWMRLWASVYGVDPEFVQAVAIVESRMPGVGHEMSIRTGPLGRGKYQGPMAIISSYRRICAIEDPFENIRVGTKALQGDERKVLRRYNASCNWAYVWQVMKIKRQLKGERLGAPGYRKITRG
jgi:hypothetical protein